MVPRPVRYPRPMSIGCFPRILDSYAEPYAHMAAADLVALNAALADADLDPYEEPSEKPAVYRTWHRRQTLGRAGLDHCGSSSLRELAVEGQRHGGVRHTFHLGLLREVGPRRYFLPVDFRRPLQAKLELGNGWFGSAPALHRELAHLAPALGVSLEDGQVSDNTARAILAHKAMGDVPAHYAPLRDVWMMLWEATRLSAEGDFAVALAG